MTGLPPRLLVGVTGSVAAIKTTEVVQRLLDYGVEVRIVATETGFTFLKKGETKLKKTDCPVLRDRDETWNEMGDGVLHIELRKWADVFVILPLSANTLAKLSNGICDNLLTCVARAWDYNKPLALFPAMNTMMWEHPITAKQLKKLRKWGAQVVEPVTKRLACGDEGKGGLPEVWSVVKAVMTMLEADQGLVSPEN